LEVTQNFYVFFPLIVNRIKYSRYDARGCTNNSVGSGLYNQVALKISLSMAFRLHNGISVPSQ